MSDQTAVRNSASAKALSSLTRGREYDGSFAKSLSDAFSGGSNLAIALSLNSCPYRANLCSSNRPEFAKPIGATTILTPGGYLVQQHAVCGLEFEDKFFRFDSSEQLEISVERLREENIREKENEFVGSFAGVLPMSRTFEFNLQDGATLKGKIALEIEDPDLINRDWLKKATRVKFGVIQVGQGRPRYTLKALEDIRPLVHT